MHSKIAILHHWAEMYRGGEAVLEQFGELYPAASMYMLVANPERLSDSIRRHRIHTSFLQRSALAKRHFRKLLPLFPEFVRSLSLPADVSLVLSTDASMVKGARMPKEAMHVCYCHSPPRYIWGLEDSYLDAASRHGHLARFVFKSSLHRLRRFDFRAAQRVDHFIANSACVRDRIRRHYHRDSVVIHPPVNVSRFDNTRRREDFYLVVSALVPYKRIDLAVKACTRLRRRLLIIGEGSELAHLRSIAGPTVEFLGWRSNEVVKDHFERCRALLFPGIEDFGITPCEAQAAGAPVLAFGQGGALETVRHGLSGLFFDEQTVDALADVITAFERNFRNDPVACRGNVEHLEPARFRNDIMEFLQKVRPIPRPARAGHITGSFAGANAA